MVRSVLWKVIRKRIWNRQSSTFAGCFVVAIGGKTACDAYVAAVATSDDGVFRGGNQLVERASEYRVIPVDEVVVGASIGLDDLFVKMGD